MDAKYSLDKYRALLEYFREIQVLTPEGTKQVVEKVRNLAEFLVYGQKYNKSIYFEEFIEDKVC